MNNKEIVLYFDGGCRGNGNEENIGAWCWYSPTLNWHCGEIAKDTTNNIMELQGAIKGLEYIVNNYENILDTHKPPLSVRMVGDSRYVIQGMIEWVDKWMKSNWKTAKKKPVKNKELWLELIGLETKVKTLNIQMIWEHCKGHGDVIGNNFVDKICNELMDGYNIDEY